MNPKPDLSKLTEPKGFQDWYDYQIWYGKEEAKEFARKAFFAGREYEKSVKGE